MVTLLSALDGVMMLPCGRVWETHVIVMEDGDDGCAYLDDSIEALGIEMLNNLLERCLVGCVTKDCVGDSRLCR
jgi:hypothetical protein